jgi:hypothetical protein
MGDTGAKNLFFLKKYFITPNHSALNAKLALFNSADLLKTKIHHFLSKD